MPRNRFDQPPVPKPAQTANQRPDTAPKQKQARGSENIAADRMAQTANQPDVATEVELEARARTIEKLPTTAQDMIAATISPAGEGALSDLETLYVRDNEAYALATTLTQRVQRFFTVRGEATEPSYYASLVQRALTEPLAAREQIALQEFQFYFTQEVNPLLRAFYDRVHTLPISTIRSPNDLWKSLQAGEAASQSTTSIFGALRLLAERQADLPQLTLEEARPLQRIVVDDPLSVERKTGYWQDRLQVQEVYGESSLPKLIALRSHMLMYELNNAAERLPNTEQNETLHNAYQIVAQWCEQQLADFTSPTAEQPDQFGFLVRQLHFVHGEPADVIDFLNAAEIIKRQNPALFERMAGISQQYEPGSQGHFETKESDLYGSVFHLGLHRSLELTIRSNTTVDTLLRHRIQSLTELNRPQPLLQHLNVDQIKALEDQYRSQVQDLQVGTGLEKAFSAVMAFTQARLLFEAKLPQMLEAIRSQEWDAEREYLVEFFKVATPDQFLTKASQLSNELIQDTEIEQVVQQRLFARAPQQPDRYDKTKMIPALTPYVVQRAEGGSDVRRGGNAANYEKKIESVYGLVEGLRVYPELMEQYGTMDQIKKILWETTTPEGILSAEFFQDLAAMNKTEAQKILEAHPEITKSQWADWYKGQAYSDNRSFITKAAEYAKVTYQGKNVTSPRDSIRSLLKSFTLAEVLASQSNIFVLAQNDYEMRNDWSTATYGNAYEAQRLRTQLLLMYKTHATPDFIKNIMENSLTTPNNASHEPNSPAVLQDIVEHSAPAAQTEIRAQLTLYCREQMQEYIQHTQQHEYNYTANWMNRVLEFSAAFLPDKTHFTNLKALVGQPTYYGVRPHNRGNTTDQFVVRRCTLVETPAQHYQYIITHEKKFAEQPAAASLDSIPLNEWDISSVPNQESNGSK